MQARRTPLDAQDTHRVENCTREEREARSRLEAQWSTFAASNGRICVEQGIGGYPATCLEMYGPTSATRFRRTFGQ
jgi:hypothetical protein